MTGQRGDTAPPTDDKRWRLVNATMRRYGYQPRALIETLNTVQESFGYLDETALRYVAACLRVPLSKTYGVATFYHFFSLKPQGRHSCVVCLGTACYIKGGANVLEALSEAFAVPPGHTTPDGALSLLTARCIGSCGLAPAGVIDNVVTPRLTAAAVIDQLRKAIHDGA
ncbi:MAG: bidirectional hydrogenase complex protein HoxE [Anaerolineae bacterium]|jgi:bidirectional [NiFe] hydrogenase diaphorase subunit|nr:bidirectional hydrogenase complex protein HoxE [Anaerolineae bacterium]